MSYTDDERIKAKRRALYILAERDHSKKELYDKLIKNYPADLCTEVVELMTEFGYMDEEKYGRKIYNHYMNKGWGKSKIRFEMKRRGLPESLIRTIGENYDCEDFIDKIIQLVLKKYANKLDFSDYSSVSKVSAALARRGYDYEDIKIALNRIKSEGLLETEYEDEDYEDD